MTTPPKIEFHIRMRQSMTCGIHRVLPAVLVLSASAMAAEIHDAVRKGEAAAVERLLKKDAKLANLVDEEKGTTPLYEAVDAGNLKLVEILLKAGAKVDVRTDDGMTPMLRAAAITNPEGMRGLRKVLLPFLNSGPGGARTASRKALKSFQQSASLPPGEEESRLAILRLLVKRSASVSDTLPPIGATPLHLATLFSNPKAVESLLECRADREALCRGMRPLHFALLNGNPEIMKLLIEHKADVNAAVPNGMRPLHIAAGVDLEPVRLLLDHGAEINAVDKAGAPALHSAAWNDEIFELLLARGADPDLRQANGATTLLMACHEGSATLVEKLLRSKPDVNATDGDFFTPLLTAAESGRVDLMKLLVKAGASLRASETDGRNALHLAAAADNPEAVRFLLEHKPGIDALTDFGETSLMMASSCGRLEAVALLLGAGAGVNGAEARGGLTALMFAARGPVPPPMDWGQGVWQAKSLGPAPDYLKIAALLLDKGAIWQAKDRTGRTALHWAASSGNVALVELLLAKGLPVDFRDTNGVTPLHLAAMSGSAGVAELLISKGAEVDAKGTRVGRSPLHHAARRADVKTVAILLAKGASIKAMDADKWQPLHHAAMGGNSEVISLLLDKGADLTATEIHGVTPLHLAAIYGQPQAARVLLDHGAPPAALDQQYQKSPLHCVALGGSVEIVRLLLHHRAPVTGADFQGDTPLHLAAMVRVGKKDLKPPLESPRNSGEEATLATINRSQPEDKLTIVKLLLAKGAKPQAKNQQGLTPIDVAAKFGTPEIVALLKSAKTTSPGK